MAIPKEFIEELNSRADIVNIVNEYVPLKQKGGSYWGLCPFHREKTASFHVLPERKIYHCFGCGKTGNAISFVMEVDGVPFVDAVKSIASKTGLEVPEDDKANKSNKRNRYLTINKEAAKFFHNNLKSSKEALEYLRSREISNKTIIKFGIGYSLNSWDSLLKYLQEKGYSKEELIEVGLAVSSKNGKIYDRFRNRVMFPIIDISGNVIAFGGRVLGDEKPKYLNSPDTPVFNKRKNLFALNFAKSNKSNKIILTEGYIDVISLYQAGFDCAVASLGTAFTNEQAKLLSRYTKEIVVSYDSDEAGKNATSRAIPIIEDAGLKTSVLNLKDAKDPDEYIRKYGAESAVKLIDKTEDFVSYTIDNLKLKYDITDSSQKNEFSKEVINVISGLKSPLEREVFAEKLSDIINVGKRTILTEINFLRKKRFKAEEKRNNTSSYTPIKKKTNLKNKNSRHTFAEIGIIRSVINDSTLFHLLENVNQDCFKEESLKHMFYVIKNLILNGEDISADKVSSTLSKDDSATFDEIISESRLFKESSQEELSDYINIILNRDSNVDEEKFISMF